MPKNKDIVFLVKLQNDYSGGYSHLAVFPKAELAVEFADKEIAKLPESDIAAGQVIAIAVCWGNDAVKWKASDIYHKE